MMSKIKSQIGRSSALSIVIVTLVFGFLADYAFGQSNPAEGPAIFAPSGLAVVGPFGIFVPGPSPVPPFTGTTVDFEGFAEGTPIVGQYSGLGVTFTQDDLTPPMIDNHPTLFGYGSSSGVGLSPGRS